MNDLTLEERQQLAENNATLLGIHHDTVCHAGPMLFVHDYLIHDYLMIPLTPEKPIAIIEPMRETCLKHPDTKLNVSCPKCLGEARSAAKARASRANGKLGGRPRKK